MSLHVTVGCMFSGKSTQALGTSRRYQAAGAHVLIIKHMADAVRGGADNLRTHDSQETPCLTLERLSPALKMTEYVTAQVVIIEEAQFFSDLKDFCVLAVEIDRKDVYVYGLDGNYKRQKFGQIYDLGPLSDSFEKINTAFCQMCVPNCVPAIHTCHTNPQSVDESGVAVGGLEIYMPTCRRHFLKNMASIYPHAELV